MCRHSHDRAGAVSHHDIVRDKDRNFHSRDGVDGAEAVDAYAGLVLDKLRSLKLRLLR